MLDCLLRFFRLEITPKSEKKESHQSMSNDYSNLILPADCEYYNRVYFVYDSVNTLLEADTVVFKRSYEIIDDFCSKLCSGLLISPIINHYPPRNFNSDHVFDLLAFIYDLSSSNNVLSVKVELLFNILKSFTRSRNEDVKVSLSIFLTTIYLSLIKGFYRQKDENMAFIERILGSNMLIDESILKLLRKIKLASENIQNLYLELEKKNSESTRFSGEELRSCASLIEEYNQISFESKEEISGLSIILSCYSCLLDEAQKMEQKKNLIKLDYRALDICITNIIVYFLKFLSLDNPQIFEVLKRCLTWRNLKYFHAIKPSLLLFKKINFFDFDYKNFQYKMILELIDSSSSLCEEIYPGGVFRIKRPGEMSTLLSLLRETLISISELNIHIDQNIKETLNLFLERPEHERFQKHCYREIFNDEQIEDMILFGMIDEINDINNSQDEIEINDSEMFTKRTRASSSSEDFNLQNLNSF